ncbi:MAG: hypothetical protein ACJ8MR_01145 [Povalibacter sp.]
MKKQERSTLVMSSHTVVVGVLACMSATAGPRVLEESARIVSPNSARPIQYLWDWDQAAYASRIGVYGDNIIVSGAADGGEDPYINYQTWIFQRAASGKWNMAQDLGPTQREQYFAPPLGLAIEGNVAIADGIFERGTSGWTRVASLRSGQDTEISNGVILNSVDDQAWSASVTGKTANSWQQLTKLTVPNIYHSYDGEFHGGDVDISGTQAIIAAPDGETSFDGDPTPPTAAIFEGGPQNWTNTATLLGASGKPVAIDNGTALVGGALGTHVFTKLGGSWQLSEVLQSANQYHRGTLSVAKVKGNLVVLGYTTDDLRGTDAGSLSVWQRSSDGTYDEVATLVSSDLQYRLGYDLDINGRRVVATGNGAAYVWDLPTTFTQPQTMQDDFEDGNDAGWSRLPGSTFAIVNTSAGRVYQQTSVAGDAGSYFGTDAWKDQAIETDATATAFNGSDRWFGVAVRRKDASNYYYATLRQSNVVSLRKMVNGAITTLVSKPLPVALNRNYRLRLEAVGTRLRVYVDGVLQLEAIDKSHSAGQAGLQMYRTSAQYDNVVVTPNPQVTLYANDFQGTNSTWTHTGNGSWSVVTDGSKVFRQSDTQASIGARALTGIATGDQIVESRVKPVSFDSSTNPWFGLITRYVDDNNYYYVALRKDGNVSLRKLVNGTIQVLQTKPFTVTAGRWYTLRFESVGTSLRVYVDGTLALQAHDSTFTQGKYGLMTYRTAAEYDDVKVRQP